ncbi:MAG: M81 family metallopeptidase [Deltaproteobacteria bacterium]|nr:M81 family metallopeptidase [Deltaproteobacteria bacterium]
MFRIAYGRLFHEANAYSPILTTLSDFERMHLVSGAELERATTLRGTELKSFMPHAELTGFRQALRFAHDVTLVPLESSLAVPGGPLARECFDELVARMLDRIEAALPLDAIYLALHGSMQVEGLREAPEAFLLRRVREVAGERVKIAVSYDLHANLSAGLVDPASVLVAYRTNPHWDLAPTGYRAGRRLLGVLRGEIDPVHAWRKLPMVLGGGTTIDFLAPMRGVFRHMRGLEKDPRVVSASLFTVHPYTDAERIGWAVHVSTNGDRALADRLADELADRAWAMREIPPPPMRSPEEALDVVAKSFLKKLGPVTFVDVDDVVGAGAPGGNTHIVKALLARGGDLRAFVPVHDPALAAALADAPIGSTHDLVLRGTPGYDMPEVPLRGARLAARAAGELGSLVRLDVGPLHLVVADRSPLPIHPSFWKSVGLSARSADVIVQKNFFHYRLFYATTSFEHVPVVSAGATSLTRIRDRDYDIPMAPKAKLADWRPFDMLLKEKVRYDAERDVDESRMGRAGPR